MLFSRWFNCSIEFGRCAKNNIGTAVETLPFKLEPGGAPRLRSALRQLAQLPWFARNVLVRRLRDGGYPYADVLSGFVLIGWALVRVGPLPAAHYMLLALLVFAAVAVGGAVFGDGIQLGVALDVAEHRVAGGQVAKLARERDPALRRMAREKCAVLLTDGAMHEARIESSRYPRNPLDVLAQQIVAMVAMEPWTVDDLYSAVRSAGLDIRFDCSADLTLPTPARGLARPGGDAPPRALRAARHAW